MCVCRLFSNLTHTCTNATQGKVIARNTKKSFGIIYKKKLPIGRSAKHVSVLLRQPVLYIYKWLKPLSSLSTHHISFHDQTQLLSRTHQPFTAKGSICLICENYKRKQDNHVNIHEKLLTFYSSEAIDITPVDPTHYTEHLSISETKKMKISIECQVQVPSTCEKNLRISNNNLKFKNTTVSRTSRRIERDAYNLLCLKCMLFLITINNWKRNQDLRRDHKSETFSA